VDPTELRIRVFDSLAGLESTWRFFETEGSGYAFQSWPWISTWQEHVGSRMGVSPCPVLIESERGEPLLLLPLGTRHVHHTVRLEWLGGELADYHAPLLRKLPTSIGSGPGFQLLWQRVRRQLPRFDVIRFERMPATVGTFPNPFVFPGCVLHPCRAHATRLHGTLDEFLREKRSSNWMRKERRKERRLADHGEIRFVIATQPEEIDEILPEMIRQKSRSYRDLGATDLFADPGYREFLSALTRKHAADGFVFLCALKVGERISATYWGVVQGRTFYHLLPTYALDELTRYAPGNLLLRRMFEWCLAHGIEIFDFTSGDDDYKSPWCDRHLDLYDYHRGVTSRGKFSATAERLRLGIKRRVKQSPALLRAMQRMRARLGPGRIPG
jgi:CelD/BcsL family acetyltransferase involved in cellulose biosynthesis